MPIMEPELISEISQDEQNQFFELEGEIPFAPFEVRQPAELDMHRNELTGDQCLGEDSVSENNSTIDGV
jgi:hypothetical protein